MEITELRKADLLVLDRINAIITDAKEDMRQLGRTQWQDGYPAKSNIIDDISRGCGYLLVNTSTNAILGYAALIFTGDPHYSAIDGKWITSADSCYAVIHRLAIDPQMKGCGLASHFILCLENCAKMQGLISMRIDTNYDNGGMIRIMEKLGYQYTGIVTLPTGKRQAYEKIL